MKKSRHSINWTNPFLAAVLVALLMLILAPAELRAELPPRPEPPVEVPGGFIELQLAPAWPAYWTQVQWLAGDGNWYDVNGWAGEPNAGGTVLWYVGPELLKAAPSFRWHVLDGENGQVLAASDEFWLPQRAGQLVEVTVDLPAESSLAD